MRDIENARHFTIDEGIRAAHEAEWYVFATGGSPPRYIAVHNGWHPRELRSTQPAHDSYRWIKLDPVTERRST